MIKILVSACLLGQPVRYNGVRFEDPDEGWLARWRAEGRLVPYCPEVSGGLPVPRPPAEIVGGNGAGVLDGLARVISINGDDLTEAFLNGARGALDQARTHGVGLAVLKERSPSCGSGFIYDGSFQSRAMAGSGVTAALLLRHSIPVFNEDQLEAAAVCLGRLEGRASLGPQEPERRRAFLL